MKVIARRPVRGHVPKGSPMGQKQLQLLNMATLVFVLAWLAVACFAIAYLISN